MLLLRVELADLGVAGCDESCARAHMWGAAAAGVPPSVAVALAAACMYVRA